MPTLMIMFLLLKRSLFHLFKFPQLESILESESEEMRRPPGRGAHSDEIVTESASGNLTKCKRNLLV